MHAKKITWVVVVLILGLITAQTLRSYDQGEKNFLAFVAHKKNLSPQNIPKSLLVDIDNDRKKESLTLQDGRLTIKKDKNILWKSPETWWIDNFVLADANNDGTRDLNLSVWKAGNFGNSKPFWVTKNDLSVKNHFFVFTFTGGKMKPLWQSSNLSVPNCDFTIGDIDNDSKNELLVIEGEYSQKSGCDGKYIAIWKWNGWGFSNEWRSKKGQFNKPLPFPSHL